MTDHCMVSSINQQDKILSITGQLRTALKTNIISQLQYELYLVLLSIPKGYVATYSQLSKLVHCNSPRAIGQLLKKNPFPPIVPCHRVVRSNRSLGGFTGSTENSAVKKKFVLLHTEGVTFDTFNQKTKKSSYHDVKVNICHLWRGL